MAKSRLLLIAIALAAAAAAISACGSSSTLSKDELAKKADAICLEGRVKIDRDLGPAPNSPAGIAAYDAGFLRLFAPLERRIEALKPSKSEEADWKAYLAARKENIDLAMREEPVARKGDQKALQAFNQQRQTGAKKRAQLAKKLGLKVCGNLTDQPNVLGPNQPAGPPSKSVHYVKPKNTLDQVLAQLRAAKTCDALNALHNSDDPDFKKAECQGLLPGFASMKVIAKDSIGPVALADVQTKQGFATVLLAEDGKDGRLKLATLIPYEGGAIHRAPMDNDAVGNMSNAIAALRAGDGSAFHAALSEASTLFPQPTSTVAQLKSPTGAGVRMVADLKADHAAKPQTLAVNVLFGFFSLRANGHNYLLFNIKGPTGYKFQGYYPQPAG
jgi:hypothetical protein